MRKRLKDAEHLIRVALLFAIGLVAFFIIRAAVVPAGFGTYGHYRDAAPQEIAARPISYAGHSACEDCHSDVVELKKKGAHAAVACESCHGPLAKHASDPAALKPTLPDTAVLCVRCHQANGAKPKDFPQVDAKDHSGGAPCGSCHTPHSPKI